MDGRGRLRCTVLGSPLAPSWFAVAYASLLCFGEVSREEGNYFLQGHCNQRRVGVELCYALVGNSMCIRWMTSCMALWPLACCLLWLLAGRFCCSSCSSSMLDALDWCWWCCRVLATRACYPFCHWSWHVFVSGGSYCSGHCVPLLEHVVHLTNLS